VIGLESLPRIAEGIRRYFGADEVVPPGIIALTEGGVHPELLHHMGIRRWTTGPVVIGAAVGNLGMIEVFNPAQVPSLQPLIVVVTRAIVTSVVAAVNICQLTLDGGAGAVPTANLPLDTRNPGIQSLNRISNASVGVSGVKLDQIIIQANNDGEFRVLPFVLGPNHRLNIWNTNPNTALTVVMSGFEYLGRSEELAA
jgi:hypothetical protein